MGVLETWAEANLRIAANAIAVETKVNIIEKDVKSILSILRKDNPPLVDTILKPTKIKETLSNVGVNAKAEEEYRKEVEEDVNPGPCKVHSKTKGFLKPKSECTGCWELYNYNQRHGIKGTRKKRT